MKTIIPLFTRSRHMLAMTFLCSARTSEGHTILNSGNATAPGIGSDTFSGYVTQAFRFRIIPLVLSAWMALFTFGQAQTFLVNGYFEEPILAAPVFSFSGGTIRTFNSADVAGWQSTTPFIEIWSHNAVNQSIPVPSFEGVAGTYFAELNAGSPGELFQTVTIPVGANVDYIFRHRARQGVDTMALTITSLGINGLFDGVDPGNTPLGDDVQVVYREVSSDINAWYTYSGDNVFVSNGGLYRFGYKSISTGSGNPSVGNFLDGVEFGIDLDIGFSPIPEPSTALLGAFASLVLLRRRRTAL